MFVCNQKYVFVSFSFFLHLQLSLSKNTTEKRNKKSQEHKSLYTPRIKIVSGRSCWQWSVHCPRRVGQAGSVPGDRGLGTPQHAHNRHTQYIPGASLLQRLCGQAGCGVTAHPPKAQVQRGSLGSQSRMSWLRGSKWEWTGRRDLVGCWEVASLEGATIYTPRNKFSSFFWLFFFFTFSLTNSIFISALVWLPHM